MASDDQAAVCRQVAQRLGELEALLERDHVAVRLLLGEGDDAWYRLLLRLRRGHELRGAWLRAVALARPKSFPREWFAPSTQR